MFWVRVKNQRTALRSQTNALLWIDSFKTGKKSFIRADAKVRPFRVEELLSLN